MNRIDQIYKNEKTEVKPFSFNEDVAEVFDDMLERSIPFYSEMQFLIREFVQMYYKKNTYIYDVGCSTGNTILNITKDREKDYRIIATDYSQPVLEKARIKCSHLDIDFRFESVEDTEFKNASIINSAYVLQFVSPHKRKEIIIKMFNGLCNNGILILCEKLHNPDSLLNDRFIKIYENFKLSRSYSKLEINQKKKALQNVLVPFTLKEYMDILKESGFKTCEVFLQFLNFTCIAGIKS